MAARVALSGRVRRSDAAVRTSRAGWFGWQKTRGLRSQAPGSEHPDDPAKMKEASRERNR